MSKTRLLNVTKQGDVTIVVFGSAQRHLDELGLEDLRPQLESIIENIDPPRLVLDMSATEFFGSSFVDALFRLWKRLNSRPDAKFAICGLHEYCREILHITRVDQLLLFYTNRDEAIAALTLPPHPSLG